MIQLDGSQFEGGGSILRQALALSILTGKDFNIKNIRANRANPGLAPQHLAAVNAAVEICGATVWGNTLGSSEVYFKPGALDGSIFKFDIGTAGSCTLLLQAVMVPAVFSRKKMSFTVTGGTDVSWSAPYDYFKNVFVPQLRRFADIDVSLSRRGYYPKGEGEIKILINSRYSKDDFLPSIILSSQNNLLQVRGVSHASSDLEPLAVCERQADSAKLHLKNMNTPMSISHEYVSTPSTGSGITLWAVFGSDEVDFHNPVILGSDALGERAKKAEAVGFEAADNLRLLINSGACADEHLADQLIPYLGLAGGVIKTSAITNHTLANISLAELFLDVKFEIKNNHIGCNRLV